MSKNLIVLLFSIMSFQLAMAQKTVSGKVSDSNGDVLPGVTVQIKGTNTGEITNFDGEYSIKITGDNVVLLFSYLGMKTKEITYTGQAILNVVLEDESTRLNEIVVIGYGAVKKRDVTGTISSVKDS